MTQIKRKRGTIDEFMSQEQAKKLAIDVRTLVCARCGKSIGIRQRFKLTPDNKALHKKCVLSLAGQKLKGKFERDLEVAVQRLQKVAEALRSIKGVLATVICPSYVKPGKGKNPDITAGLVIDMCYENYVARMSCRNKRHGTIYFKGNLSRVIEEHSNDVILICTWSNEELVGIQASLLHQLPLLAEQKDRCIFDTSSINHPVLWTELRPLDTTEAEQHLRNILEASIAQKDTLCVVQKSPRYHAIAQAKTRVPVSTLW